MHACLLASAADPLLPGKDHLLVASMCIPCMHTQRSVWVLRPDDAGLNLNPLWCTPRQHAALLCGPVLLVFIGITPTDPAS